MEKFALVVAKLSLLHQDLWLCCAYDKQPAAILYDLNLCLACPDCLSRLNKGNKSHRPCLVYQVELPHSIQCYLRLRTLSTVTTNKKYKESWELCIWSASDINYGNGMSEWIEISRNVYWENKQQILLPHDNKSNSCFVIEAESSYWLHCLDAICIYQVIFIGKNL